MALSKARFTSAKKASNSPPMKTLATRSGGFLKAPQPKAPSTRQLMLALIAAASTDLILLLADFSHLSWSVSFTRMLSSHASPPSPKFSMAAVMMLHRVHGPLIHS